MKSRLSELLKRVCKWKGIQEGETIDLEETAISSSLIPVRIENLPSNTLCLQTDFNNSHLKCLKNTDEFRPNKRCDYVLVITSDSSVTLVFIELKSSWPSKTADLNQKFLGTISMLDSLVSIGNWWLDNPVKPVYSVNNILFLVIYGGVVPKGTTNAKKLIYRKIDGVSGPENINKIKTGVQPCFWAVNSKNNTINWQTIAHRFLLRL